MTDSELPPSLLARLDACADERRDPLDDAAVLAWLDEHPEDLEGFAVWRRALADVSVSTQAMDPVRAPRAAGLVGGVFGGWALGGWVLGALAAAGVVVFALWGGPADVPDVDAPPPTAVDPHFAARTSLLSSGGELLSHSTSVVVVGEDRWVAERWRSSGTVSRRDVDVVTPARPRVTSQSPDGRSVAMRSLESLHLREVVNP